MPKLNVNVSLVEADTIIIGSFILCIGICIGSLLMHYSTNEQINTLTTNNTKLTKDNKELVAMLSSQELQRNTLLHRGWTMQETDDFISNGCLNYIRVVDENVNNRHK